MCTDRQIRMGTPGNQACHDCPDYTKGQNNNSYCSPDYCTFDKVISIDGSCQECPLGQEPGTTQRECVQSTVIPETACTGERQITLADGSCTTCPQFTQPQAGATKCAPDLCDPDQVITTFGACETCPGGTQPDATLRSCFGERVAKETVCGHREVIVGDGICYACPNYTRAQDSNQRCEADRCERDQILRASGECETCLEGTWPDSMSRSCVATVTCNEREVLNPDQDLCEPCPDYTRAQPGNTCGADVCIDNQIVSVFGQCESCPPEATPDATLRFCLQAQRFIQAPPYPTEPSVQAGPVLPPTTVNPPADPYVQPVDQYV